MMMMAIEVMLLMLLLTGTTKAQQQQQQQEEEEQRSAPGYYYQTYMPWLYAMPWRPLIVPTPAAAAPTPNLSQLSPGYTGPQTFPSNSQQQAADQPLPVPLPVPVHQQLGLFMPQPTHATLGSPTPLQNHFTLPFRPSPFVGYTDDDDDDDANDNDDQNVVHNEIGREPPFHAPGQKPVQEAQPTETPQRNHLQTHFVYMSPSYLYNLVRN
ncbi:uncharacterized protein Dwil_GK24901 [Drosophila willistoni]|uniref:DUF4794 domain-containing protein n=1 Tax=Drosophila willistoni TaxID=7260 RepID=B4NDQ7_DROWI|nr:uncharacterized protein LOC6648939 [Drosophila willistoni]EDW82906.1 uncharacterized protein Dwil_GK24901 [Drosophila willistoni]